MGKATATTKTPLFCQSKLLCFSLLYLFTTLFLAFYHKVSPNNCLFRSSPFDPIQSSLFRYPPSYGEHKYATTTHRHSCSSPVFFSGYGKVAEEIHNLCKNSSTFLPALKYLQVKGDTFGGNLSFQERISYFNHTNNDINVPCGFLKEFPVSDSDRIAMESCNGVVVASAIFNDHDKIRQPIGLGSKTLEIACFFMFIDDVTLQGLHFHKVIPQNSPDYKIGVWRIIKVFSEKLYENPAMNGVIPKYLVQTFPELEIQHLDRREASTNDRSVVTDTFSSCIGGRRYGDIEASVLYSYDGRSNGDGAVEEMVRYRWLDEANGDLL
ncbi:hypothetical protein V6N13_023509 [Hibiscus sabdariffa]|uniref:TOD1/MUCI70 glycosyltransferase-like domain-containing protein n=1 Tax=Hibiscus sabdariffa TaxID=183260 RepID=A0ABR2PMD7_9ROSI